MAKTTIASGGVNSLVPEEVEAVVDTEKRRAKLAGSSSSKSIGKPKKTASKTSKSAPSPAPTTAPSSSKGPTASGSAAGTGGPTKSDK